MNNNNPLVSIIIPTYNRASLIRETLDSVLEQTYTNWECIIVDDGSEDKTEEVVREYVKKDKRFQFHKRPDTHKSGGNGARNYGFNISRGEYIQWFDSDDLMSAKMIDLKANKIAQGYDVVFSAYEKFTHKKRDFNPNNTTFSGDILNDLAEDKVIFSTHSFMMTRKSIKGVSFNENVIKAQDLDFFFRFFTAISTIKIGHIDQTTHFYRKHESSISEKKSKSGKELVSKFYIENFILNYFVKINNKIGVLNYEKKNLFVIKHLTINKNYLTALRLVSKIESLSFYRQIKIKSIIIVYSVTKRGLGSFKYNND